MAYTLMLILAVAAAAVVFFIRYNSHTQKAMRGRRKDQARREKQALEK